MPLPPTKAKLAPTETTRAAIRLATLGPVAAQIAFVLELTLVPVLLPSMRAEFGLSLQELAWVFNAYSIAMAVGIAACAAWGDRFAPIRVFGLGVAAFLAGSVLIYLSDSNATLLVGRVCQGLGAGVFSPLIPVLLTRVAADKPGRTLILWGSIAGYIAASAPLAYGTVLTEANWNIAFLFIASVAGLSMLLLSVSNTSSDASPSQRLATSYASILKARALWITLAYVFITYGAISYFLFRVPLLLAETGMNTANIGFVLSVLWLSFSALSAMLRNMVDNHRLQLIMVAAPVLIALGLLLALTVKVPLMVVSACLVGCGLACSNAPSTQLVLRFAPKGLAAFATSMDISVARIGGILTVTAFAEMGLSVAAGAIVVSCVIASACAFLVANQSTEQG